MWMAKWHHNGLTSFKVVNVVIDGDVCATLKNGDKCVATCAMACNLFACSKAKEGDTDSIVLRKGLADDLARKACNLVFKSDYSLCVDVLHDTRNQFFGHTNLQR